MITHTQTYLHTLLYIMRLRTFPVLSPFQYWPQSKHTHTHTCKLCLYRHTRSSPALACGSERTVSVVSVEAGRYNNINFLHKLMNGFTHLHSFCLSLCLFLWDVCCVFCVLCGKSMVHWKVRNFSASQKLCVWKCVFVSSSLNTRESQSRITVGWRKKNKKGFI